MDHREYYKLKSRLRRKSGLSSSDLRLAKLKLKEFENETKHLQSLIEFHERDKVIDYLNEFGVYEIDDGGTHCYSARSVDEAEAFHCDLIGYAIESWKDDFGPTTTLKRGYETLAVNVDDNLIAKTCAEWAEGPEPQFISTTEC